mmetsp:Transcript_34102/g.79902  ORF Transcript_34102/g.79902 Transcript_34102/m.79902 type:complete len:206 (-) Transcript_34102:1126-1743(-)
MELACAQEDVGLCGVEHPEEVLYEGGVVLFVGEGGRDDVLGGVYLHVGGEVDRVADGIRLLFEPEVHLRESFALLPHPLLRPRGAQQPDVPEDEAQDLVDPLQPQLREGDGDVELGPVPRLCLGSRRQRLYEPPLLEQGGDRPLGLVPHQVRQVRRRLLPEGQVHGGELPRDGHEALVRDRHKPDHASPPGALGPHGRVPLLGFL